MYVLVNAHTYSILYENVYHYIFQKYKINMWYIYDVIEFEPRTMHKHE